MEFMDDYNRERRGLIKKAVIGSTAILAYLKLGSMTKLLPSVASTGVNLWIGNGSYSYGEEIYALIENQGPLYNARLEVRNASGTGFNIDLPTLSPGANRVDIGTAREPAGWTELQLKQDSMNIASVKYHTGPINSIK